MNKNRFRIGNIYISRTNPQNAQQKVIDAVLKGNGGYICVTNMRMVRFAGKNLGYAQLMKDSFMNLPDGKPLTWCGKLWGLNDVACTSGPEFFAAMLDKGDNGLRHYLLGDTQDVLDAILIKNNQEMKACIVGAESLPFTDVDKFDYEGISQRIKDSGANIVWTAMRAPKQDYFNQKLYEYLPNVVSLGVGRAFRLLIGKVKAAPKWASKLGIAGVFTRRKSLLYTLWWYTETFVYLIIYMFDILIRKGSGKSFDD